MSVTGGQRGLGELFVLRCPGRALCGCFLEELTCSFLPVFLLSIAVSQWVGQTPCGSVSHVGLELLGDSGTVGLSLYSNQQISPRQGSRWW